MNIRSGKSGFTLVEALVSVVILSVGMIVVLRAFETTLAVMGEARDCIWANRIIQEKISEVVLSSAAAPPAIPETGVWSGGSRTYYGDFVWELRVFSADLADDDSGGGRPPVNIVTVSAGRAGRKKLYSGTAYIGVYGEKKEAK